MQPTVVANPFGKKDAPPKKEVKREPDEKLDVHKSKAFGSEFPWVKGDIEFNGLTVKDVGIRYKGNSTYTSSQSSLRRPFKIDINHYVEDQKLHTMGGMALNNNVVDATRLREPLGYHAFRAAKVPAPRTAYIKTYLSVAGKYDKSSLGVYTLIEPVDKRFLREHFGSDAGMLLKPEKLMGLSYLGERWAPYKERYSPKRATTPAQEKRLIEFCKLVSFSDEATFRKKIADYLDVDCFLRFAAVNCYVSNLDSFFGTGHNYYLYLNPKTDKFVFIPYDLDLSFGGMPFADAKEQLDWSISKPYMGRNKLTERILAMKEHQDAYRAHLKALVVAGPLSPKALRGEIDVLQAALKDATGPAKGFGFGFPGKKQDLRDFVARRAESVEAQLDGRSQGTQITGFNMGAFGKKK
jgi:spore coat protein CotH